MLKQCSSVIGVLVFAMSLPVAAQDEIPGPGVGEPFEHALNALDQNGESQTLDALMGERGVVVFFVRSADWCPFCQRQIADFNQRLAEFEELGLTVVSVSVDEVSEISNFSSEQQIGYTMLADPEGDINDSLGIRDLQYPVGSAAFGVPRPIIYIIDRNKLIRSLYMEPTYRTRPDLDVVLRETAELDF